MITRGEACHSSYVHILHSAFLQILPEGSEPCANASQLISYMPGTMSLSDT